MSGNYFPYPNENLLITLIALSGMVCAEEYLSEDKVETSGKDISDGIKMPPKDYSVFKGGWCSNTSGRTMEEAVTVLAWNGPGGKNAEKEWIAAKYPDAQILRRETINTFDMVYTWYSIKRPGMFLPQTVYFNSTDHYLIF